MKETIRKIQPTNNKPMKTQSKYLAGLATALGLMMSPLAGAEKVAASPDDDTAPRVQLAILLDTSGSMSGLIHQARTQMWQVVNTFISAKQDGKAPHVEVALYEYGNDGLSGETHWVRKILPLTRDLDAVSEKLFALTTNGGSEYCGAVIERAAMDLEWDKSADTYKAIFIAGNEPFTQGPVKASEACRAAATKGVVVNTIHCGDADRGIREGWKDGAVAADGQYLAIDSNKVVAVVDAPQDVEILKLNESLNRTYLAYGRNAAAGVANQVAQDANASNVAPAVISSRIATKASANYYNGQWDLVDASKAEEFDFSKIPEEELPEEMRKMTAEERKNHIAAKAKERGELQARILELNRARESFLAEKAKESAEKNGEETLDAAMIKAVRTQATARNYTFEK